MTIQTLLQDKQAIQIIGAGGTGRNSLNYLAQHLTKPVHLHFFDDNDRSIRNSQIASKHLIPFPLEEKAQQKLRELVQQGDAVVLIASASGQFGYSLIQSSVALARAASIPVAVLLVMPFEFETEERITQAEHRLDELRGLVDECMVISNDHEQKSLPESISLLDLFNHINKRIMEMIE